MKKTRYLGAEQARSQLPALLAEATKGYCTVITRHGKSVAAIVPVDHVALSGGQQSMLTVAGSGKGLWGRNSRSTLRLLRGEWDR